MSLPDAQRLLQALEATWPPVWSRRHGPFTLREGAGGGKRVSATTLAGAFDAGDLAAAEVDAVARREVPLYQLRPGDEALDTALGARGYVVVDPTYLYAAPVEALLRPEQRPLAAIASEGCLGIMAEIWAAGGIGPERLQVMARASDPKAWILGRMDDRAAGVGFVALDGDIAMVHALEIADAFRRRGTGAAIMARAAKWAGARGARHMSVAVVARNAPANALYRALGMELCGRYHYRVKEETPL